MRLAHRLRKAIQLHNGRYTPLRADSSSHRGGNENHALIRGGENCSAINAWERLDA